MRSCVVLLSVLLASVLSEDVKDRESLLVQINSGLVRGYKDPKNDIFVFNGIPYATAPTGTGRFKGPLPPPAWMSIFEAVDDRTICPQINVKGFIPDSMIMTEDCLVANVYVPKTKKKNLPVVVYVHGGAFLSGFGTLLTPKELKPAASGTPMWPAAGINGSPHMALKKDPEIKGALLEERCLFWNEIYDSHYKFSEPPLRSLRQNTEL